MEKENPQDRALKGLKSLRQEFEAAAAYARGNKGKTLRAWFTGENPGQDEAAYVSYARKLQGVQELLMSPAAEDRKKALTGLVKLKADFEAVADANRALPPPGFGALTLAAHPALTFIANPKAMQFDEYTGRVNSILRLLQ
ncbi:MAG: hypothetical protein K8R48_06990 [Alphaproteobacteria bacterium]|nr:hypothetical protein [Alphaproteobacteria bacterium]